MKTADFRFYGELNDFLPGERRQRALRHAYLDSAPVKDIIESLGVPHTEVHLILVNGISSGFSYTVRDGDSISVYPVFRRVDIGDLGRASPEPPGEPRFVSTSISAGSRRICG